jgi:uncharacterized protein
MALDYLRRYTRTPEVSPTDEPRRGRPLTSVIPGRRFEAFGASSHIVESSFPFEDYHGGHRFADLALVDPARLAVVARDPELSLLDLARTVFLDTETTGLGMGTGTYVFLVGLGFLDGDTFRVVQVFLTGPGDEAAFLAAITDLLANFNALVTFNGKAFDWPLLAYRFLGSRQFRRAPLDDPLHLDLLHPARRLWRRRLESCALSSLEQHILGVSRTGEDVPGWLIPSLYFQYLRSGNAEPLAGVFYHNLVDILSLAALTTRMDRLILDPLEGLVEHPADFLSLGRAMEKSGLADRAVACLEESLARQPDPVVAGEALVHLAGLHKRERRWEAAMSCWDRLIDGHADLRLDAMVERAKYYEHLEGDYFEALDTVQRALDALDLGARQGGDATRRDLEHRRARLIKRIYRDRSWDSRRD